MTSPNDAGVDQQLLLDFLQSFMCNNTLVKLAFSLKIMGFFKRERYICPVYALSTA